MGGRTACASGEEQLKEGKAPVVDTRRGRAAQKTNYVALSGIGRLKCGSGVEAMMREGSGVVESRGR
ncbi:hypothetical protein BKA81DRAFT_367339 [Phyllosticta paracitricarpa]